MANEAEFNSPLGDEELLFYRMQAREELGRLPEFRLELLRNNRLKPLTAAQLLGKNAGATIIPHKGSNRYLNGIVTQFERGGTKNKYDVYRVVIRPWLWKLTLGSDCRIFQDKTVVQILNAIFAQYGGQTENKLTREYVTRPYTVQYRESDFNFVSRLMEESGIYYYFMHSDGQHKMVLCDSPSGHSPVEGDSLEWGARLAEEDYREDVINAWIKAHLLQSRKYSHTDFSAEAPSTSLFASADRPMPYADDAWEVYDYPGDHDDLAMGTNLSEKKQQGSVRAQNEVDRFESLQCVGTGLTPYRLLAVGMTFSFAGHDDAGGYLVTSSITEMEFAGYDSDEATTKGPNYSCRFNCVPKNVAFQPEATTPRAVVRGPQTATVVGPSGDEIHTDKYGRVKVHFHWDRLGKRDEKSSCWVRVSHPWSSKKFGAIALPRIGDEVVVDFLEGNPDRPLITGRVYNGENMPPYDLPAHASISGVKTHSTKGGSDSNFNELRFEDLKGSEYIWFQAEKDYHQWVKHDSHQTIGNHAWLDIAKNFTMRVGENSAVTIKKNAALAIGKDTEADITGDARLAVGGSTGATFTGALAILAQQAVALQANGAMNVSATQGMNLSTTTAMNLKATTGVVIDGGMQLTIKAGGSYITVGPAGVAIQGVMVQINSGGAPGSASDAQQASPAKPQAPAEPPEHKDPLA